MTQLTVEQAVALVNEIRVTLKQRRNHLHAAQQMSRPEDRQHYLTMARNNEADVAVLADEFFEWYGSGSPLVGYERLHDGSLVPEDGA